jgi:type IV secretion system protein VirB8
MSENTQLVKFFAERVDWDESIIAKQEKSNKFKTRLVVVLASLLGAAVIAIITQSELKELIPITVMVDRLTGKTDVTVGRQKIDMTDSSNELRMTADLGRFVQAREGFTRGEAESNYQTVWYMTAPDGRGEVDKEFRVDLNPNALSATMKASDQIKLENMAVSFLPSDTPEKFRAAQVRYDKIKRIGSTGATTQRFISTITFTYDPANIPKTVEGIVVNPYGFTKLNYRRDKETEEHPIALQQQPAPAPLFATPAPAPAPATGRGQ